MRGIVDDGSATRQSIAGPGREAGDHRQVDHRLGLASHCPYHVPTASGSSRPSLSCPLSHPLVLHTLHLTLSLFTTALGSLQGISSRRYDVHTPSAMMARFSSLGKKRLAATATILLLALVTIVLAARVNQFQDFFCASPSLSPLRASAE